MSFEEFKKSIIWQNSGKLSNYEEVNQGSHKVFTEVTGPGGGEYVLTAPNSIRTHLVPPFDAPTAVELKKWFPIKDDIYFSQWRYLPSSNLPLHWLSLLKMWEAWRDKDNHRNNYQITCAVNEDLELSGRGKMECPSKNESYNVFDWWDSDETIPLDEWFRIMVYIRKHESSGTIVWFLDDDEIFGVDGIPTHFIEATQFYASIQTYYSDGPTRTDPIISWVDETVAAKEYVPLDYRVVGEPPKEPPKKTLVAQMLPFPILLSTLFKLREKALTEEMHRKLHPLI